MQELPAQPDLPDPAQGDEEDPDKMVELEDEDGGKTV